MPDRSIKSEEGEVGLKTKLLHDPLTIMKKYTEGMKSKEEVLSQKSNKHVFPITSYSSSTRSRSSSLSCSEKKHKKKKHKKHKSKRRRTESSSDEESEDSEDEVVKEERRRKLEVLRMERLAREKEERKKAEMLLAKINGVDKAKPVENKSKSPVKQKYNSQFNPDLAKQNYF